MIIAWKKPIRMLGDTTPGRDWYALPIELRWTILLGILALGLMYVYFEQKRKTR